MEECETTPKQEFVQKERIYDIKTKREVKQTTKRTWYNFNIKNCE